MAQTTIKAYVDKKNEKYYLTGTCRGFKVEMDMTEESGGTNKGMNPMEMVLCGLGGCEIMSLISNSKEHKINIGDVWIELEGDYDTDGATRKKDIRPGFLEIRCIVHVKSDAPEEKVRELVEKMQKSSPVYDTISNAVRLQVKGVVVEK
ncbi:OsmC-like protein [Clostridium tepidiprofundi DSM 19306]|uniref:OsmC-like protein n=1 Tax=Clostridium tepidiprofundi DSM 19306 TaxID=1121338 RepID=A0A151B500_9CLOT|nr:OsmC family protein [Clostridium tepidiprofundi]KYH34994.1 OsmC-like protein [Clostridium tepidiprofundi DSM 19306]